ncbi:hypothetical protein GCM10010313_29160 [Streptomyces violarus]|uniref:Transposase n=1 Tax=Streptomyces violarus TaxID=67380 RepID=A0A7W4ZUW0_9ACTN|nr:hypothetical protein [Streptomyces violarus]GHD08644.1 hypothetical protein GCM10010313_29160 [Streptomyces violarus]
MTTFKHSRGSDAQRGSAWRLPLADHVLLVATYWRTNLTSRQVAPLFGVSKSAADRILDHFMPLLAISPARRPCKDTVSIVDGTLVPTRDRSVAASSKNYRYSTNLQIVIDANSRLVVTIGLPLPGSRNDCRAFTKSGVDRVYHCSRWGGRIVGDRVGRPDRDDRDVSSADRHPFALDGDDPRPAAQHRSQSQR